MGVREDVIPGDSINWLLGKLPLVQSLLDFFLNEAKSVVLPQVLVLEDHPVGIAEFDSLEEVGQVFVDYDLGLGERVAPLLKQWVEASSKNNDNEHWEGNEDQRRRLADPEDATECVTGLHGFILLGDHVDNPVKNLEIREHPVSIDHEEKRGVLEHTHCVLS